MKKKLFNYAFVCGLLCTSLTTVNASNLSSKIKTNVNDIFGDGASAIVKYDSATDVNNLTVRLTVDDSTINKLLSQRPGVDVYSSLGIAYYMINPELGFDNMYKENSFFLTSDGKSIAEMKAAVSANIGEDDLSTKKEVWAVGAKIEYSLDNGKTWKTTTAKPDGKVSVGENLLKDLNLNSLDELVYGKNFRISMWGQYNWLFLYQNASNRSKEEWIRVDYILEYPVSANTGDTQAYYPSLEEALSSGEKDITLNKDVTITKNISIPSDTKLTIAEDVTVTLNKNVNIDVQGEIINKGTIVDTDGKKYVTITPGEGVTVSKRFAKEGESIEITYEQREGYEVTILYLDDANNFGEVIDSKLVVPANNIQITVDYKKIPVAFKDLDNTVYDGKDDLVFTVTGEYELFDKLYINDKEVDKDYYSIAKGSTIITLDKFYLSTLENGEYTLKVTYTDGESATTTFKVDAKKYEVVETTKDNNNKDVENPKTLDNILTFVGIAVVSLVGIAGATLYLKKNKTTK